MRVTQQGDFRSFVRCAEGESVVFSLGRSLETRPPRFARQTLHSACLWGNARKSVSNPCLPGRGQRLLAGAAARKTRPSLRQCCLLQFLLPCAGGESHRRAAYFDSKGVLSRTCPTCL